MYFVRDYYPYGKKSDYVEKCKLTMTVQKECYRPKKEVL